MKKVVYHGSYGDFGLTLEAIKFLIAAGVQGLRVRPGGDPTLGYGDDPPVLTRDNPVLVSCIEILGDRAGANLKIAVVDTPEFHISEYDGFETVRPAIRVNGKKYALVDEHNDD